MDSLEAPRSRKHDCAEPGCTEEAIFNVEDGKWLCVRHTQARINSPENRAMMQMDEELDGSLTEVGRCHEEKLGSTLEQRGSSGSPCSEPTTIRKLTGRGCDEVFQISSM